MLNHLRMWLCFVELVPYDGTGVFLLPSGFALSPFQNSAWRIPGKFGDWES